MKNLYILVLGLNMGMDLFKDLLYIYIVCMYVYIVICVNLYIHTKVCRDILSAYTKHIHSMLHQQTYDFICALKTNSSLFMG